jgi:hypothetical protein
MATGLGRNERGVISASAESTEGYLSRNERCRPQSPPFWLQYPPVSFLISRGDVEVEEVRSHRSE